MYRCDKCGREWTDQLAVENDLGCTRKCRGKLQPAAETEAFAFRHWASSALSSLPSVLAIPVAAFGVEAHPMMRLHRLCDAAEIVTRFCTIVALGELRQRLGDVPLPSALLETIQANIERPTFGAWRELLRAIIEALDRAAPLVVRELPEFVTEHLLPGLSADPRQPEINLVELRNRAVHGGGMTVVDAKRYLDIWEPWLAAMIEQLDFLADTDICYFIDGRSQKLAGTQPGTSEIVLSADLRQSLHARNLDQHVLLLRGGRWIDLWPLCDYGRATSTSLQGRRQASTDGPMIYYRAERDRLLYAALGVDLSQGERSDAVGEFRKLFRLNERVSTSPSVSDLNDYEEELQADAQMMVGRVQQLHHARSLLQQAQSGIFWLSGPGGIGKSLLTAALAMDPALCGDSRKICRIAWRFKASDTARCRRSAFLRHAMWHLAEWLQKPDVTPDPDEHKLQNQFVGLLDEVAKLQPPSNHPQARARRVLFIIDGLDEIERSDELLPRLIFQWQRENVIWLCSGRAERTLSQVFSASQCTHVFPARDEQPEGGLPPMSDDDIRGMLLDGLGEVKYDLLELDAQRAPEQVPVNPAVAAVVRRARGLPLYVHFVVQDLLSGHLSATDLNTDKLPADLERYYEDLLRRLSIGDLQAILTPLLTTVAWAKAPLPEATLHLLMVRRTATTADDAGRALVRQGLESLQSMLRAAPIPGGNRYGYEPYHLTFREHLRRDPNGVLRRQNQLAQESLCSLVCGWSNIPTDHPAKDYVLRFGPGHLLDNEWYEQLAQLARDEQFLKVQAADLPEEPAAALVTLQAALHGAMAKDDASEMAEFLLRHARLLHQVHRISPLQALRTSSLSHALKLTDLVEPQRRSLWYLLLVWELLEANRGEEAGKVQRILLQSECALLQGWMAKIAATCMGYGGVCDGANLSELAHRLLNSEESRCLYCELLTSRGVTQLALEATRDVNESIRQAELLAAVAQAQATTDDPAARATFRASCAAAQRIANLVKRTATLARVGRIQAQSGIESTDAAFGIATDVVQRITNLADLTVALAAVAREQFEAGNPAAQNTFAEAVAAARRGPPEMQDVRLLVVGEEQARAGDAAGALSTLEHIKTAWIRTTVLAEAGLAQARAGVVAARTTFAAAGAVVGQIPERESRESALTTLGCAQAKSGDVAGALGIVEQLSYAGRRVEVLAEVGRAQFRAGDTASARATLSSALVVAQDMSPAALMEALREIALVYAEGGDEVTARTTALSISYELNRAYAMAAVGLVQAQARDGYAARDTFAAVISEERLTFEIERVKAMAEVGQVQGEVGNEIDARRTFAAALEVAQVIPDESQRSEALVAVALAQALGGDAAAVDTALQVADSPSMNQWTVLKEIAEAQCRNGDFANALATARQITSAISRAETCARLQAWVGDFDAALTTAEQMCDYSHIRTQIVTEVGRAQAQAGDRVGASATFAIARTIAQQLEFDTLRAKTLAVVGWAQAEVGDTAAARDTFVAACAASQRDKLALANTFAQVARLEAQFGDAVGANAAFVVAYDAAQCIRDKQQRDSALAAVAREQAWAGELTANDTAQCIDWDDARARALVEVGQAYGRAGHSSAACTAFAAAFDIYRHTDHDFKSWDLVELAQAQAQAGYFASAFDSALAISEERARAEATCAIGEAQAKALLGAAAVRTAEMIQVNAPEHLPKIAAALVKTGDKVHFKQLLPLFARHLDASFLACGQLARLYPYQSSSIRDLI